MAATVEVRNGTRTNGVVGPDHPNGKLHQNGKTVSVENRADYVQLLQVAQEAIATLESLHGQVEARDEMNEELKEQVAFYQKYISDTNHPVDADEIDEIIRRLDRMSGAVERLKGQRTTLVRENQRLNRELESVTSEVELRPVDSTRSNTMLKLGLVASGLTIGYLAYQLHTAEGKISERDEEIANYQTQLNIPPENVSCPELQNDFYSLVGALADVCLTQAQQSFQGAMDAFSSFNFGGN